MNLDEYRAMKAEAEAPVAEPVAEPVVEEAETTPTEPLAEETPVQEEIEIDGVGKVAIDELKKGYLRQSDYTRKTQEIAEQRKLIEDEIIKLQNSNAGQNGQVQQYVSQQKNGSAPTPIPAELANNPFVKKITDLEQRMYDMMLRTEVADMKAKYNDFDVVKVLTVARDKNITNLEDAYQLYKATIPAQTLNADEMREQIRKELLDEMLNDKKATKTLISATDKKVQPGSKVEMTADESRIAQAFGMTPKEYLKWKDGK